MPGLDTNLHTDMLRKSKKRSAGSRLTRATRAFREEWGRGEIYGLGWGDPETSPPLQWVRDRWLLPYVRADHTAIEIGPGGGRWTRYMLGFERVYAVDFYPELLAELRRNLSRPNVVFVQNHGTDFPGVPPVDFVFSFGTFVHLDPPLIEGYLRSIRGVLKPGGQAVLQYADKTKPMGEVNEGFSDMTPGRMRELVGGAGLEVAEEDTATLWHSALIRFGLPAG